MKSNNRIESLIPGPSPKFVKSNDEFGIISIRASGKGETQPEELAAPAEDRYQRAGRLRAQYEIDALKAITEELKVPTAAEIAERCYLSWSLDTVAGLMEAFPDDEDQQLAVLNILSRIRRKRLGME